MSFHNKEITDKLNELADMPDKIMPVWPKSLGKNVDSYLCTLCKQKV